MDGVVFDFLGETRKVFPSIPANPEKLDLQEYLSHQQKDIFKHFVMNPDVFRHLPLIPGMEELIPYFNSQDTYVVSSRWKKVQGASVERINEVGLKPKGIIFTSRKGKAVEDNNLDVLIEDQPKYAEQVRHTPVLMPALPYNKQFLADNVYKYNEPHELLEYLKRIEGAYNGRRKK